MAQVDGIDVLVLSGTTVFTCATDISITYEQDVESPPPCKGAASGGWEVPARGAKRGSGTISGIYDDASTFGARDLDNAIVNETDLTLHFTTNVVADERDTVTAIITSSTKESGSTGPYTYSADFVISGAPTLDVIPSP
jgi:hypothetical protein